MVKILFILFTTLILWAFFTYKLTEIPPGINGDEAAIFYNAASIADTGKDLAGKTLPFLVASDLEGWHKPVNVYLTVILFKIFGVSYFMAKVTTVILGIISCLLVGFLCYKYAGKLAGFLGLIFTATTPIVVLQTHFALENIAIIPFTAIWLLGMYEFSKDKSNKSLFLAAFGLTFIYHSYNAGRFFTPIWIILSYLYIILIFQYKSRVIPRLVVFTLLLLPLIISIPLLEYFFDGSFFVNVRPELRSYIQLIHGYIANFDLSFLFIKGDKTPYHSVANYGMFLVLLLPFFLLGIYHALTKKGFPLFVLITFLLAPLFFGTVDSLDRASRLLALVPHVCFLAVLGFLELTKHRLQIVLLIILSLGYVYNFSDFINYYWNKYQFDYKTEEAFTDRSPQIFEKFSLEANKRQLTPYVEDKIFQQQTKVTSAKFFTRAYLGKEPKIYRSGEVPPHNSLILSLNGDIEGMKNIDPQLPHYRLIIKD